jgi:hypothetical protein
LADGITFSEFGTGVAKVSPGGKNAPPFRNLSAELGTKPAEEESSAAERNGQELSVQNLEDARLVVEAETSNFKLGKIGLALTFRMDPARKPTTIDLTVACGP